MADIIPRSKREGGLPRDWTHRVPLEGGSKPYEPPSHVSHPVSRCAAWVWALRGTGAASLEANLIQKLMAVRYSVLFEVFLDLHKAYDALDRERALDLLSVYGVGSRTVQLLRTYWDRLTMVDKAGGYFG